MCALTVLPIQQKSPKKVPSLTKFAFHFDSLLYFLTKSSFWVITNTNEFTRLLADRSLFEC